MILYPEIQSEVFAAAKGSVSENIDLTTGSGSYYLFSSEAAVLEEDQLQFDGLQNSWSVNSAVDEAMDLNCGFLLNTRRNYINFQMSITITNHTGTNYSLTTAYSAFYTSMSVNYYFSPILTAPMTIPHSGGSVTIQMLYIGLTFSDLPFIASGTALSNTATEDLSLLTTSDFDPIPEGNETYRLRLQTVYAVKGRGTINSLKYGIQNIPYVTSSEVYIGNNTTGTVSITGKATTYILNYGVILAIVDSQYINNISVQTLIGTAIFNLRDILNTTYHPGTAPANQILATVTADNGQTFPVYFYTAVDNDLTINLVINSLYPLFNDTDIANILVLIQAYLTKQGIGGQFFFSDISAIVSQYYGSTLNISDMSVADSNTTGDHVFVWGQLADQIFNLITLNINYTV
jgi:hypothetical protein